MTTSEANAFLGTVNSLTGRDDFLFRLSLKALIVNSEGNILVVKESGRDWWDLPGGGMDHGETLKQCLVRELREEVSLTGDFEYEILSVEDARPLLRVPVWQVKLIFVLRPRSMIFEPGDESDEVAYMQPDYFRNSSIPTDQNIYTYWQLAKKRKLIP